MVLKEFPRISKNFLVNIHLRVNTHLRGNYRGDSPNNEILYIMTKRPTYPNTFLKFPTTLKAQRLVLHYVICKFTKCRSCYTILYVSYIQILFLRVYSPGTVILLVASGLNAAFPALISLTESFFLNLFLVLFYVWVCLFYKQDTQLSVAKFLTFIYSMIMTITIVGLMVQVGIQYLDFVFKN